MACHSVLDETIRLVFFSALFSEIEHGRGKAYIPHDNRLRQPFHPSVKIGSERDMVIEEFQHRVAFFLLVADNGTGDCFRIYLISRGAPGRRDWIGQEKTYIAD